jgi:cytochrome c-type biogenesis protein CcmH
MARILALALFFTVASAAAAAGDPGVIERKTKRLEQRLLAPCCFQQTLDIHSSDLTTALRREIATRLAAGESSAAVEGALVERYGARIRAVPVSSPLEAISLLLMMAIAATGGLLWWRVRAWTRLAEALPVSSDGIDAHYDERIDEYLRKADE